MWKLFKIPVIFFFFCHRHRGILIVPLLPTFLPRMTAQLWRKQCRCCPSARQTVTENGGVWRTRLLNSPRRRRSHPSHPPANGHQQSTIYLWCLCWTFLTPLTRARPWQVKQQLIKRPRSSTVNPHVLEKDKRHQRILGVFEYLLIHKRNITTNASLFQKIEKLRTGESQGKGERWPLGKRGGKGAPHEALVPFHRQWGSCSQELLQVRFALEATTTALHPLKGNV